MLDVTGIKPGETLVQNGANSACGMLTIQIARAKGYKTINIVRKPEVRQQLLDLGADHVIVTSEVRDTGAKIRELTGGKGAEHFFDCVGGQPSKYPSMYTCTPSYRPRIPP